MKLVPYRKPPTLYVGRNQPCPCKSGKKFKHCCLPKVNALEDTSNYILRKPL